MLHSLTFICPYKGHWVTTLSLSPYETKSFKFSKVTWTKIRQEINSPLYTIINRVFYFKLMLLWYNEVFTFIRQQNHILRFDSKVST